MLLISKQKDSHMLCCFASGAVFKAVGDRTASYGSKLYEQQTLHASDALLNNAHARFPLSKNGRLHSSCTIREVLDFCNGAVSENTLQIL